MKYLIFLLLLCSLVVADEFYVNTSNDISNLPYLDNDIVYFKTGVTFYESLNISGTNVTVCSYGDDSRPEIKSSILVSGWSNYDGYIYMTQISSISVSEVYVDNILYNRSHEPDNGYFWINSSNKTHIIDANCSLSNSYIGSDIYYMSKRWWIEENTISDISSCKIELVSEATYETDLNNGFYTENKLWMLDNQGEWWFNETSQYLYLWMADNTTPENNIIEVGSNNYGILINNATDIIIENISIKHSKQYGINIVDSDNIFISKIEITDVPSYSIYAENSNNIDISNSVFGDSQKDMSIYFKECLNSEIDNITIKNSGMVGKVKNHLAGIKILSQYANDKDNIIIKNSNIYNVGYIGIFFTGNGVNITNNTVNMTCLRQDDCGGIYTIHRNKLNDTKYSSINNNFVMNIIGSPAIMQQTNGRAKGIYLDDNSAGLTVNNNFVYNTSSWGINVHNGRNNTIRDNIVVDSYSDYGISLREDSLYWFVGNVANNTVVNNIVIQNSYETIGLYSYTGWYDFGSFNNNSFYSINNGYGDIFGYNTFEDWNVSGHSLLGVNNSYNYVTSFEDISGHFIKDTVDTWLPRYMGLCNSSTINSYIGGRPCSSEIVYDNLPNQPKNMWVSHLESTSLNYQANRSVYYNCSTGLCYLFNST